MRKPLKFSLIILMMVVVCLGSLLAIEARMKIVRRMIDNVVYDNRNHYLPCEKLPNEAEVNQVVQEHQAVIHSIEQVNPGFAGVDVDSICPGKADLVIWYASHQDRVTIEGIISGDTFLGIPYRLQNR
jgi:hypothetical protein